MREWEQKSNGWNVHFKGLANKIFFHDLSFFFRFLFDRCSHEERPSADWRDFKRILPINTLTSFCSITGQSMLTSLPALMARLWRLRKSRDGTVKPSQASVTMVFLALWRNRFWWPCYAGFLGAWESSKCDWSVKKLCLSDFVVVADVIVDFSSFFPHFGPFDAMFICLSRWLAVWNYCICEWEPIAMHNHA